MLKGGDQVKLGITISVRYLKKVIDNLSTNPDSRVSRVQTRNAWEVKSRGR